MWWRCCSAGAGAGCFRYTPENNTSAEGATAEATIDGEPPARKQQHLSHSKWCAVLGRESSRQNLHIALEALRFASRAKYVAECVVRTMC